MKVQMTLYPVDSPGTLLIRDSDKDVDNSDKGTMRLIDT
jgi:hypothetical protein